MFMGALGAVVGFATRAKQHEHVAKVRLMFDPLVSGEGADRAIEAVVAPLLDNRDQREAHELLKLAAVSCRSCARGREDYAQRQAGRYPQWAPDGQSCCPRARMARWR